VFIEHRRYEAPERCPRCLMRTGTIVDLVRHGYSPRVFTPRSTSPLGNRNMSAQIEG
jgi:hypothetical protein